MSSNAKTFSISNGKWISHLQMDIFCHLKFCHNKRNSFTLHSTIQNEIYFVSRYIQKRSNKILGPLCFRRPCVPTATAYWAAGVFSIFDATHRSESGPSIAKGLRLESNIAIQFIAGLSWSRKFCLGDIFKGLLTLDFWINDSYSRFQKHFSKYKP